MPVEMTARIALRGAARATIGLPYLYGRNTPSENGFDCSGGFQWWLWAAEVEPWKTEFPTHRDMRASDLFNELKPLGAGEHPLIGDGSFYGSNGVAHHVVMVTAVEVRGNEVVVTEVIGASGGMADCTTLEIAKARRARVRAFSTHLYRKDFIGFRRPELA